MHRQKKVPAEERFARAVAGVVRSLRQWRGMTQNELGRLVEQNVVQQCNRENARPGSPISLPLLYRYAKVLGVKPSTIIERAAKATEKEKR